ncbi:MAG: hypothetical protein C0594_16080 [Marinilabiliales bacterium]|nr:MAG: hypothetical protein C0594_16080 [Marinilabiliales bacterium]
MKSFTTKASKTTPEIIYNENENKIAISGNSYPENPFLFYEPCTKLIQSLIQSKELFELEFKLEYYNTSTAKQILDFIDMIEDYYSKGGKVKATWLFKEGDDDLKENGVDFFEDCTFPTSIQSY